MFAGLDTEAYDRQYTDRMLMRRMLHYFGAYRRQAILTSLMIVLLAVMNAAPPFLVARRSSGSAGKIRRGR